METYAFRPSGVMTSRTGFTPTGMLEVTWLVAESITVTEFERAVTTKSCGPAAVVLVPVDGGSARQVRATAVRTKPRRKGDRSIESVLHGVVIALGVFLGFSEYFEI